MRLSAPRWRAHRLETSVRLTPKLTGKPPLQSQEPETIFRVLPLEHNILEWHFCLMPPDDCPYSGGQYHGKLILPKVTPDTLLPPLPILRLFSAY